MSDTLANKDSFVSRLRDPSMLFSVMLIIVVLMLIVPIPTFLLDFLMVLSMLSGIMILLTVAYAKNATDFSVFPTMLLVTTIFRLAINVSSTRLVLTKGAEFDGKMVRAFGSFVVGSSDATGLVVGVIIFIILIIVQFMVITKGATRVSEVAARFSLDKMPNKFMAIDMEQQNGVITEEEAIRKRQIVDEESAFYGSMDGASKFVQGDVIVGILVTIVNVIGGFSVGMLLRNEPFDVAVQNYISLSIGDGLVAQIPSLLISFSTGLIVTKAQANNHAIGDVIWTQLTQQYKIFTVSGATLLALALLPGFPHIILIALGALMIYAGTILKKKETNAAVQQTITKEKKEKEENKGPEDVSSLLKIDPLTLHIGYELIPLVNGTDNTGILNSIAGIRRSLAMELGLVVPPIRIQDNIRLLPNEYIFKIRGQDIGKGSIKPGYMMAMGDGLEPVEGEKTVEPAFGLEAYWIKEDLRAQAENIGYTVVDPPTIVSTHLQELLRSHSHEILDREATNELLEHIKKEYPVIVNDVLNEAKFSKSQIQKILQNLLMESVSIRDLPTILETLSEYNPQTPIYDLVEIIRQSLKRVICNKYKNDNKELFVLRIHPKIENEIYKNMGTEKDGEPVIRLNPDILSKIQISIRDKVSEMYKDGYPPVIITQPQIRKAVWEICQYINKNIAVLSTRELVSDIDVHLFGQVAFEEKVAAGV